MSENDLNWTSQSLQKYSYIYCDKHGVSIEDNKKEDSLQYSKSATSSLHHIVADGKMDARLNSNVYGSDVVCCQYHNTLCETASKTPQFSSHRIVTS